MYRHDNPGQMKFEDFYLPFGGRLRSDNRWVILSKQIPWEAIEQEYWDDIRGQVFTPCARIHSPLRWLF